MSKSSPYSTSRNRRLEASGGVVRDRQTDSIVRKRERQTDRQIDNIETDRQTDNTV